MFLRDFRTVAKCNEMFPIEAAMAQSGVAKKKTRNHAQAKSIRRSTRKVALSVGNVSYADDRVILIVGYRKWDRLAESAYQRLLEELAKLDVQLTRRNSVSPV